MLKALLISLENKHLNHYRMIKKTKYAVSHLFLFTFMFLILVATHAQAARIKEVASFEGVRENHLIGYGLVVGLTGTGDKVQTQFTVQSLVNMLNRLGISVDPAIVKRVKVKNVAAVVVTTELSPFARPGSRVDILVSSIGDAKSLQGGTLLFTPLRGADGDIYVVSQGAVSIGGFLGGGEGATVQKNHLTVGRVPSGGLVEKEVPLQLGNDISLILKRPDFTTSAKMVKRINMTFGDTVAMAVDGRMIKMRIPRTYKGRVIEFLARVEGLNVPVDTISRVVLNERTGTIVIGENVKISTVAVAHGNITVEISTTYNISQPPPFSPGETVVQPEVEALVKEEEARLLMLETGVSLGDLIKALNALGVTPRDLVAILQAIKAAGALQAELQII